MPSKAQIAYLSHGAGPFPILGDPSHKAMVDFMTRLAGRLKRPEAIVVISAHWEESVVSVLGGPHPPLLYDYYGFPEGAYDIEYPAPGCPDLAGRIMGWLADARIPARRDDERGFDHGVFIPLKLMYPQADIPVTQISLVHGFEPEVHIDLGKALHPLLSENVLVLGSGFSFHNMNAFSRRAENRPDRANDAFQNWLIETCMADTNSAARERRLVYWRMAPSARYCHPREEHLMPLHVCAGLAERRAEVVFDDYIQAKRAVAFLWE